MRTEHLGSDNFPKLVTIHVVFHISIEDVDSGVMVEVAFLFSIETSRFLLGKARKSFGIADGLYHEVDMVYVQLRAKFSQLRRYPKFWIFTLFICLFFYPTYLFPVCMYVDRITHL